jgi:hypothetical protein
MIYQFRDNHSCPVPAQVVGERLAALDATGELTPSAVVADARPARSPLHPAFEWDDRRAGPLYREDQARRLIRSVAVLVPVAGQGQPARQIAFVSVGQPVPGGALYTTTTRALSAAESRARVLEEALAQLRGWQERYQHLTELAEVFQAIEEVAGRRRRRARRPARKDRPQAGAG